MNIIIFNSILYLTTLYIYYRKNKIFSITHVLLIIYAICSSFSILAFSNESDLGYYKNITLFPFIYQYILILIAFAPFLAFKQFKIKSISPPNPLIIDYIAYGLIAISIFSQFGNFNNIINTIQSAILDSSVMSEMYLEMQDITSGQTGSSFSNWHIIINTLSFDFRLLLLFYYLTLGKKKNIIIGTLLVTTILDILNNISSGQRVGIVTTLISIIFLYVLFKPFYEEKIKKRVKLWLTTIITIASIGMLIITIGRFANYQGQDNKTALNSVYSYAGQSFLNFNERVLDNSTYQYGDNSFPLFRGIIGLEYSKNIYDRQQKWGREISGQGYFYTFIGDLCFDFGPLVPFIFLTILSIITYKETKQQQIYQFHQIIFLYLYFRICSQGVFYFTFKTIGGNLNIIFSLLMYLIFKYSSKAYRNG